MKILSKLLGVAVLGLAIGVLYGQQPVTPYTIHGRVLNSQTGKPIARVLVTLQDTELRMVVTDNNGQFTFAGIRAESAQLRAAKQGFFRPGAVSPASMDNVVMEVNSRTDSIVLKLSSASSIRGRITSAEGELLETVPVTLFFQGLLDGADRLLRRNDTSTNEDGEFSFNELPAGQYFILAGPLFGTPLMPVKHSRIPVENYGAAFYPGVSDPHAATPIALGSGQDLSIDLSLQKVPLFALRGEVTGWRATENASLQILPACGTYCHYDLQFDSTTGQFHISKIPPGVYTIRIFSGDSPVAQLEVNLHSNILDLKLPLSEPRRISAIVHSKDHRAEQAYVNVTLLPEDKWQQPASNIPHRRMGETGEFFVREPEPGKYWAHFTVKPPLYVIAATCGATDLLREALVITDQSVPPIELIVGYDSATFGGQVHSEGLPVPAQVLIVPVDPPGESRVQATNLEGRFSGLQIGPGTYRVWAFDRLPRRFRNADALEPYALSAKVVTFTANQTVDLPLEIVALKAGDGDE